MLCFLFSCSEEHWRRQPIISLFLGCLIGSWGSYRLKKYRNTFLVLLYLSLRRSIGPLHRATVNGPFEPVHFLLKSSAGNRRNSTKNDIWCFRQAPPSLHQLHRACHSRKEQGGSTPWLSNCGLLGGFQIDSLPSPTIKLAGMDATRPKMTSCVVRKRSLFSIRPTGLNTTERNGIDHSSAVKLTRWPSNCGFGGSQKDALRQSKNSIF
jgi:hypothetical protein